MKKAEAISILATSVRPREAKDRARYDEAVKMAIEALKSSEQTVESAQNVQDEDLISKLSEIRSEYNCFDEDGEPQYRALSEAIRILSQLADGDTISRRAAIDALHTWFRDGFDEDKWWNSTHVLAAIEGLPSAQQGYKWETCFECPLSHGCPKIKGCTNEQAIEYASQIPNDCPLSVHPEPHWIPCSEKLPEYNESVLTWDGYAFCIEKRIPYIRDDDGEPIEGDWWVSDEYDEYESEYYPNLRDGAAIAWMPLPEPYQGGDAE